MWKHLYLLLGICFVIVAADEAQLRVSVRKDVLKGVPATMHAFSQVELLNLHQLEPITIMSVQVAPEETYYKGKKVMEQLPQQLHISRLPSTAVKLEVGQVAIVPLTFLPRFPHDEHDMPRPSRSSGGESPQLTEWQAADLKHFVGIDDLSDYERRSNLNYNRKKEEETEYEVRTRIIVETSRGTVDFPITASSSRYNEYAIPERIQFYPSKERPYSIELMCEQNRYDENAVLADEGRPDCYHIHIANPHNEILKVSEVSVSKPDMVSLFMRPKDATPTDLPNDTTDKKTEHQNSDAWIIAPNWHQEYIATVCPIHNGTNEKNKEVTTNAWVDDDTNKLDISMGHVQIRTNRDTLFIMLERYIDSRDNSTTSDEEYSSPKSSGFKKLIETSPFDVDPKSVFDAFAPITEPSSETEFTLTNRLDKPARIMRLSSFFDEKSVEIMKETKIFVKFHVLEQQGDCPFAAPRPSHATEIDCETAGVLRHGRFDPYNMLAGYGFTEGEISHKYLDRQHIDTNRLFGRLLVWGTYDEDIGYEEWRRRLMRDPQSAEAFVYQILIRLVLVGNRVEHYFDTSSAKSPHLRHTVRGTGRGEIVKSLFFPYEPWDQRMWQLWRGVRGRDYEYQPQGIANILKIMGLNHEQLLVDERKLHYDENDKNSVLCERFYVDFKQSKGKHTGGSYLIGTLSISYDYGSHYRFSSYNIVHPTICNFTYDTLPIMTGIHKVSLVVFPGNLEISANDGDDDGRNPSSTSSEDDAPLYARSLISGSDNVMAWFLDTDAGFALQRYMYTLMGKAPDVRDYLLTHLVQVGDILDEEIGYLHPIVVNVGAIAKGEIQTTPLYFTNYNPVPIQLFFDRCEIEGMSIGLARESARVRGDGNNILDYIPDITWDKKVRGEGKWHSHHRKGLRHFLTNSELATNFFAGVGYRDAIKLSEKASRRFPFLRDVYKTRAKVNFNTDPKAYNYRAQNTSACPGSEQHPARYYKFNSTTKFRVGGSVLLSTDGDIIHYLNSCEMDVSNGIPPGYNMMHIRHTPVTIPPGGVAKFHLKVRAPSKKYLKKDVTPFVASGLVLSTDHGQIMPIIVTFEALLGQIKLSRNPEWKETVRTWQQGSENGHRGEIVEVPLRIFRSQKDNKQNFATKNNTPGVAISPSKYLPSSTDFSTFIYPFGATELDMYVSSSFSREITVRQMESCNPWFTVAMTNTTTKAVTLKNAVGKEYTAAKVGALRSAVSCPSVEEMVQNGQMKVSLPAGNQKYPSFYQCALEWLHKRSSLQSQGCGKSPFPQGNEATEFGVEDESIERAKDAITRAIAYTYAKYNSVSGGDGLIDEGSFAKNFDTDEAVASLKAGSQRKDEILDQFTLDVFAEVADAWRALASLDLHTVTSTFRATIDYAYSNQTRTQSSTKGRATVVPRQSLTVGMNDVVFRTTLSIPRLVKQTRPDGNSEEKFFDSDFISVVNFPDTPIADVVAMRIPLQNPTDFPVKVKLGSATWEAIEKGMLKGTSDFSILEYEGVRESYLSRFDSIYAQDGKSNTENTPGKEWWDGGGSYFLVDELGNMIQSRHNTTIKSLDGTHISLANPSLHTQSAFIVGCGARCGLRNESPEMYDLATRSTSHIGAAAAAGFSLLGKTRRTNEDDDGFVDDGKYDAYFSPGAAAMAEDAPAAFAVPYSAFDEIVIPPNGEAEIGPILFRPPGRYGVLGCDAIHDSGSQEWQTETASICSSRIFESMLFLENSLTGLERVVLKGKALWERTIFLDDVDQNDFKSPFGDLEFRHGQSALIFPGTLLNIGRNPNDKVELKGVHPIVKSVLVHNAGDFAVEFTSVFFSDSSRGSSHKTGSGKALKNRGCSYRGFTLYGCINSSEKMRKNENGVETLNLRFGFKLEPGQSIRLLIEHTPDCITKSEFISLHLKKKRFRQKHGKSKRRAFIHYSLEDKSDGKERQSLISSNMELLVGFEMTVDEMKNCVPFDSREAGGSAYIAGIDNVTKWNKGDLSKTEIGAIQESISIASRYRKMLLFESSEVFPNLDDIAMELTSLTMFLAMIFFAWALRSRYLSCFEFMRLMHRNRGRSQGSFQSNWMAAFRCLARANPTAVELQAIGREQARQLVLNRYKNVGVLTPQCITSGGSFVRTRPTLTRSGESRHGKDGEIGGNEKLVTLSDGIFQSCDIDKRNGSTPLYLSCGLGWKRAVGRGVLSRSAKPTSIILQSKLLYEKRRESQRSTPKVSTNVMQIITSEKPVESNSESEAMDPILSSDDGSTDENEMTDSSGESATPPNHPEKATSSKKFNNNSKTVPEPETVSYADFRTENGQSQKAQSNYKKQSNNINPTKQNGKSQSDPVVASAKETSRAEPPCTKNHASVAAQNTKNNKNHSNGPRVSVKEQEDSVALGGGKSRQAEVKPSRTESSQQQQQQKEQQKQQQRNKNAKETKKKKQKAKQKAQRMASPSLANLEEEEEEFKIVAPTVVPPSPSSVRSGQSFKSYITESTASSMDRTRRSVGSDSRSTSKSIVRPPPGLAPPPGFGNLESSTSLPSSTATNTLQQQQQPQQHLVSLPAMPLLSDLPPSQDSFSTLLSPMDTTHPPSLNHRHPHDSTGLALGQLYSAQNPEADNSSASLFQTIRSTDEKTLEMHNNSTLSMDALMDFATSPASPQVQRPMTTRSSNNKQQQQEQEDELLGLGGGFNVMDFLDNILDESRLTSQDGGSNATTSTMTTPSKQQQHGLNFSTDPWASSSKKKNRKRKPRALAYGIEVVKEDYNEELEEEEHDEAYEEEDENGDDDYYYYDEQPSYQQQPDNANVDIVQAVLATSASPARTNAVPFHAAILPSGTSVFSDDESNEGDDYNNGDFYAKLLGEDNIHP